MDHLAALPPPLADWCARRLAAPVGCFFNARSLSRVWGLNLADGSRIALKLRPAGPRLLACLAAQRRAIAAGIEAPAPLAGPDAVPGVVGWVSAETWRPEGTIEPPGQVADHYGRLLARLVAATDGLDPSGFAPPPPWLHYDHRVAGRTWPPAASPRWDPHRIEDDLPDWLPGLAASARERLLVAGSSEVVGHGDLNGLNVRWVGPTPVVHDWDSVCARPGPVLLGCLAADHAALPGRGRIATIEAGWQVLAAYQGETGTVLSPDEVGTTWAAGLWVACYNAAFEYLHGQPGGVTAQLLGDGVERLRLATS